MTIILEKRISADDMLTGLKTHTQMHTCACIHTHSKSSIKDVTYKAIRKSITNVPIFGTSFNQIIINTKNIKQTYLE